MKIPKEIQGKYDELLALSRKCLEKPGPDYACTVKKIFSLITDIELDILWILSNQHDRYTQNFHARVSSKAKNRSTRHVDQWMQQNTIDSAWKMVATMRFEAIEMIQWLIMFPNVFFNRDGRRYLKC
jgi:hypothetical protein